MPEPEPTPDLSARNGRANRERTEGPGELLQRLRDTPGLAPLVAEAVMTWRARAGRDEEPGWRAFSDAFPTFWEFTNRPR